MEFTPEQSAEAAKGAGIDLAAEKFDAKALALGMTAELEHGTASPDTDITNNDPVLTAKIAVAHLRTSPSYYAPGRGLKAWEASIAKGVKRQGVKTEYKNFSFKAEDRKSTRLNSSH